MPHVEKTAIVIAASSDIGDAICRRWLKNGWRVLGTYRTKTDKVSDLESLGAELTYCDLDNVSSMLEACSQLRSHFQEWDVLVIGPGAQEPVGLFMDCPFDEWEQSITINFTSQMRIVHELLPARQKISNLGPCVLLFAGGGTNDAPRNYSAYIISKIAQIKMCELLDAEIPDSRFVILGPGWVKTKIHDATLRAGERAGTNYQRTIQKLDGDELTPMEHVLDFCDWAVKAPREIIGGRNFSVVHDKWRTNKLANLLIENEDGYKLRRFGNDWLSD